MISLSAYRASIGGFYNTQKKIQSRTSSNLSNHDLSGNICIQHQFIQYLKLLIIREIMPCWIQYFEYFANTNVANLLLSGDIEEHPGPTNDFINIPPPRLVNAGTNTCFANSTIQLLHSIPDFKHIVTNQHCPTIANFVLDTSLQHILRDINNSSNINKSIKCHYDIRRIMTLAPAMQFRDQQDAEEFLTLIFEKTSNTQMKSLFKIILNEKVICNSQQCNGSLVNESNNPAFILPLPLSEDKKQLNTINDLINTYFTDNHLPQYRCDRDDDEGCSQIGTCKQSQRLVSISDNVLIQLKIFYFKNNISQKIKNIPIQLDRDIIINDQTLHLCGVMYHIGENAHSGHYYTEIFANGSWYNANDENVEQIPDITGYDGKRVPYILLYRKVENAPTILGNNTSVSSTKMHEQLLRELEIQKKKLSDATKVKDCFDDFFNKQSKSNKTSAKSSLKSPGQSKKAKKLGNLTPKKIATPKQFDGNNELKYASSKSNLNDEFIDFLT